MALVYKLRVVLPRIVFFCLLGGGLSLTGLGLFRLKHPKATPITSPQSGTSSTAPVLANGTTLSTIAPKPDELTSYHVAADLPRLIRIPKLAVEARVQKVGVDSEGRIDVPKNVHDAAWFDESAKPGMPGAMVIDGHVATEPVKSVFAQLRQLKKGDIISIERGDGIVLVYSVAQTKSYAYDGVDMDALMSPLDPKLPGLNLITCSGKLIKGTYEFDQRFVVFAVQQEL